MNEYTLINFEWIANITGNINISITIDPDDLIDEKNESNNEVIVEIDVSAWPDLAVDRIILPAFDVMEFEQVEIGIIIKNYGLGDANN